MDTDLTALNVVERRLGGGRVGRLGAGREGIRVNQVMQWSQAQKKGLCFAFWNMMLLTVACVELRSAL